jgi:hypothetical protein
MFQPQLEAWQGDEIHAYAALSVVSKGSRAPKCGVVWFTARTEVDKVNRQVAVTFMVRRSLQIGPPMHQRVARIAQGDQVLR